MLRQLNFRQFQMTLATLLTALTISSFGQFCHADEILSFQVDPNTFDTNMDGFITDTEFTPLGSDGTQFIFTPTNNLVGSDRLQLDPTTGLRYGGGGGSSLSFDFVSNRDISLNSYTLSSAGFFLGDPTFRVLETATVLSEDNTSNSSGDTYSFNDGPIEITANTTYSFETQVSGAGIQAYMGSWSYSVTAIPEPSSFALLVLAGSVIRLGRRRTT